NRDRQARRRAPGAAWPTRRRPSTSPRPLSGDGGTCRPSGGRRTPPDGTRRPASPSLRHSSHAGPGLGHGFGTDERNEGSENVSRKFLILGVMAVGLVIPSTAFAESGFKGFNSGDLNGNVQSAIQTAIVTQGGTATSGPATANGGAATGGSASGGNGG